MKTLSSTVPLRVVTSRENQYYLNDTVQWTKDRDFNWIEYKYNFVMGDYQVGQERWWKTGVNYINDINYQYNDPKGLLLTDVYERAPGTTQVNNHIEFEYDGLARATKVKTYLTGNGAVAAQGGVVAVAASAVSTTFDVDHTWDSSDRRDLTAFYFNDQTTTLKKQEFRNDYTWDKLHRLDLVTQQVSSAATSWVVDAARTKSGDFEYYPNSQLKKITRLQGTNTTALITNYTQNSGDDFWVPGRISTVQHSGLVGGTKTTSNDFDVAGRIIQKVTPAQTYNYAYDSTDQLTTVTNASGSTLQDPNFNAVGNDTGHTVSYYNRVLNDGTYTYEYNNEGSRTKRTKIIGGSYEVYAYDHRQRLISVAFFTENGTNDIKTKEVRYEYDALDRRFRRRVDNNGDGDFIDTTGTPDVRERLLYDTNPVNPEFDEVVQIISETTAGVPDTDKRTHRFLNGPQPDMVLTDEIFTATGTPNDILWLLQDHQNSVTDVATIPTSGSAILRNHLEYNAFGQITSQTDATYAPVQTYTGQILDTATGLLYYDARWYDPLLGRFVAEDPSGFGAGDANLSRMVGNSFPNGTDPSGLDEDSGYDESPTGYWNGVGRVFGGYWVAAKSTVGGLYTLGRHPIDSAKGIGSAIAHPVDTTKAICNDVYNKSGSLEGQGELVGDVLIGVLTGGSVKAAKEAARLQKIARLAKAAEKASEAADTAADLQKAAKALDKVKDAADAKKALDAAKDLADAANDARKVAEKVPNTPSASTKVIRTPETTAPKSVQPRDAVRRWEAFLGPEKPTNIHPRTGALDSNRLVSPDGKRSIRYGCHEMNSKPTLHHYHEETWTYDPVTDTITVDNQIIRVPFPKKK